MTTHNDNSIGGLMGLITIVIFKIQSLVINGLSITWEELITTSILAAVGSAVGFFIHMLLKYLTKKCKSS